MDEHPRQPSAESAFPEAEVRGLAKGELHVHLEGTVDAATLIELAVRHGVTPPAADVAGVDRWYRFNNFDEFLERYFWVLGLLRHPEDFALVADRYLRTATAQGVVHVEFHVSATAHILEGAKTWADVQAGIVEGCTRVADETGISWLLIPDISPHLGAEATSGAMTEVFESRIDNVAAIGMGGPADRWWDEDFGAIYRTAEREGLHLVSHAGEHGPASEVAHAINVFGAERIQHGIGVMGDDDVVAQLVDRNIACDVCPGSNVALGAATPANHPLAAMLDAGIAVTLGSDDPPMFQTSLMDEYRRAWEWCDLDLDGHPPTSPQLTDPLIRPAPPNRPMATNLNTSA